MFKNIQKVALALGFCMFSLTQLANAAETKVSTTTRVYEVPLKYIDQYDSMIKEGKLIQSNTTTFGQKNVFENQGTIVIFPNDNKYENMNRLVALLKKYASQLDNVDSEKVNRVLGLLAIEKVKK